MPHRRGYAVAQPIEGHPVPGTGGSQPRGAGPCLPMRRELRCRPDGLATLARRVGRQKQTRSQAFRCDLGAISKVVDQHISKISQALGVDGVRRRHVIVRKAGRRTTKHRDRAFDVAALDVGDADRELSQPLPERALFVRPVLPCGLKHLVGVEGESAVQQILGVGEGFDRRQLQVVRDACNAFAPWRKRAAQRVARAPASWSAGLVAIALGHPSIIAGEPHPLCVIFEATVQRGGSAANDHVARLDLTSRLSSITSFSRSMTPFAHIAVRPMSFTTAAQSGFFPVKDWSS